MFQDKFQRNGNIEIRLYLSKQSNQIEVIIFFLSIISDERKKNLKRIYFRFYQCVQHKHTFDKQFNGISLKQSSFCNKFNDCYDS